MLQSRAFSLAITIIVAPILSTISIAILATAYFFWSMYTAVGPYAANYVQRAHGLFDLSEFLYFASLAGIIAVGLPLRGVLLLFVRSRWINHGMAIFGAIVGVVVTHLISPTEGGPLPIVFGILSGGIPGFWWGLLLDRRDRLRFS